MRLSLVMATSLSSLSDSSSIASNSGCIVALTLDAPACCTGGDGVCSIGGRVVVGNLSSCHLDFPPPRYTGHFSFLSRWWGRSDSTSASEASSGTFFFPFLEELTFFVFFEVVEIELLQFQNHAQAHLQSYDLEQQAPQMLVQMVAKYYLEKLESL